MTEEHKERLPHRRTLTDDDLVAIAGALHAHNARNMGLTPDEVKTLQKFLRAFNKAAGIVGTLILTAIVAGTIAIFTKGFWAALCTGVKSTK